MKAKRKTIWGGRERPVGVGVRGRMKYQSVILKLIIFHS
jgi:hypothetical protein